MTITDYTDEMLVALRANIEYLKTVGDSQIKVREGELLDEQGDMFIYGFELDGLQNIDVDSEVEVRARNQSANGKLIQVNDNKIQIQLDTNLGVKISEAYLIISTYFLLEKLVEFLENVRADKDKVSGIVSTVFAMKEGKLSEDSGYTIPASTQALNDSQMKALRLALGSDVSFIWGPPGTGKTQTIASVIQGFIDKGMSTLLISHTNAATDSALLKTVKHLKDTKDYEDGKFIRVGKVGEELSKWKVVPERILQDKMAPIQEELETNRTRLADLEEAVNSHKAASFMVEDQEELFSQLDNIAQFFNDKKDEYFKTKDEISRLKAEIANANKLIGDFQSKGKLGRLIAGTNLNKLTSKKTILLNESKLQNNRLEELANEIRSAEGQHKQVKALINEQENKYKDAGLLSDSQLEKVETEIKNLQEQQSALLQEIEKVKDSLILDAKVVASTLTMSYTSKRVLSRDYDCVILDEASMAPLPAVFCAASIAKKKVVLVGDFLQLPPIAKHEVITKGKTDAEVNEEQRLIDSWLKRDIFDVVGITKSVKQGIESPMLRQLKVQYRMHPDISAIINLLVYSQGGDKFKLGNGPATSTYGQDKVETLPLKNGHLGIYDTSEVGSIAVKSESGSYYNVSQALLCVELTKQAIKSGYNTVGVISAYRAQVNLMQKMLDDALSKEDNKKVMADTVHRFQGGERELIIFDVTTPKSPSMYDDFEDEGDDMKLMNVAFSRAQQKCILVADVKAVKKKHSESSLVKRSIEYCENQNLQIVQASTILPKYAADDRTDQWLEKINDVQKLEKDIANSSLFTESDFYPRFIKDLLGAKQEVIINSPYITSFRCDQLSPILKQIIGKGVRIFILTRPPHEHNDAMRAMAQKELAKLEKIGVVVLPLAGYMHEKIAIVDRKVLYEGSLNILSQRDSHEFMRRINGKNTSEQMVSFFRLDKNIGAIGENNLKHCEVCKDVGAWYWTQKTKRWGNLWTFCLTGIHSPNKPPKTQAERKERKQQKKQVRQVINLNDDCIPICPVHNGLTQLRRGPFGEFYGCPQYKECNYAVNKAKVEKLAAKK